MGNADGSGDATLAVAVNSLAFSPDGARLAYGKIDALGHFGALTVRAFAGGADVVLTPPTTHTDGLSRSRPTARCWCSRPPMARY